jgi:hypothetical protein
MYNQEDVATGEQNTMSQPTIQLELPPELMERAEQIARDSNRPLETVLVESLELLFGTASDISLDVLDSYSDV